LLKVSCVAAAAAAYSSVILQSVSVGRPQFVQPPDQLCVQVLISRGPWPITINDAVLRANSWNRRLDWRRRARIFLPRVRLSTTVGGFV